MVALFNIKFQLSLEIVKVLNTLADKFLYLPVLITF